MHFNSLRRAREDIRANSQSVKTFYILSLVDLLFILSLIVTVFILFALWLFIAHMCFYFQAAELLILHPVLNLNRLVMGDCLLYLHCGFFFFVGNTVFLSCVMHPCKPSLQSSPCSCPDTCSFCIDEAVPLCRVCPSNHWSAHKAMPRPTIGNPSDLEGWCAVL